MLGGLIKKIKIYVMKTAIFDSGFGFGFGSGFG